MAVTGVVGDLTGCWSGTSRLRLSPEQASHDSDTTATVALIARDSVMSFAYTWAFDGRPQDGLILLVPDSSGERITAAWVDSWHPENQMMQYGRRIEPDGSVRVRGTYPAPPGPDWGWRIEFEPPHEGLLRVKMVSLPPEGQDQVAVEAEFTRNL